MHELRLGCERTAVGIDGMDGAAGAKQVGQRERERPGPRSELEPRLARLIGDDRVADQRDVIGMLYGALLARVRLSAYARVSALSTSAFAVLPSSGYDAMPHDRPGILMVVPSGSSTEQ